MEGPSVKRLILAEEGTERDKLLCLPPGVLGRFRGNSRDAFDLWALKEVNLLL